MSDLIFHESPVIFIALVVIILVAVLELTYRFGGPLVRHFETNDELWNAIQTGLLALVAFMLGFSFSQAQGRYDARRLLVVEEANDIGTTWLRASQLPGPSRAEFRSSRKLKRNASNASERRLVRTNCRFRNASI